MSNKIFEAVTLGLACVFAVIFSIVVLPPLVKSGDILGAFAAGFVNPYASGYSTDVFVCAALLFVWIFHERNTHNIKHGWIAIPLCFVPGVATAFGVYLFLRSRQLARN